MAEIDVDVREDLEVVFRVNGLFSIAGTGDCTGALHFTVDCENDVVANAVRGVLQDFVRQNGRSGMIFKPGERTFGILFPTTVSLADGVPERRIGNIGLEMFYRVLGALQFME